MERYDSNTLKDGHYLPKFDWSVTGELTQSHFHEVERFADEDQHNQVRNEEGSASVAVSRVRESPHVTQTDGHGDARHEEFNWTAPGVTFLDTFTLLDICGLERETIKFQLNTSSC